MAEFKAPAAPAVANSVVNTSPIRYSTQGSKHYSATEDNASGTKVQLAEEMSGIWVGPVDPETFLGAFLPVLGGSPQELNEVSFEGVSSNAGNEKDMYKPFVSEHVLV